LDRIQLEAQNQAFDDIHRVLFRLPGINIQEEDGYGLRPNIGMRGSGSERSANITLMEDGILAAPAPYAAPSAYYFPYVGRMAGVEVRKGSSQIKYGPRTNGGALNLISSPVPENFNANLRLAGGQDNTAKAYLNYGDAWKNVGWMFEAYHMQTDGFKRLDTGGTTGFTLDDYIGKVRLRSGADADMYQEFTLKAGYNEQRADETYLGLTDADFNDSPYRRYAGSQHDQMNTDHRQLQGRYFAMATDNTDVTMTVYRNEFARNWYKLDKVDGVGIADILEDPSTFQNEYGIITGQQTSADDAMVVKANNRSYYAHGIETITGIALGSGSRRQQIELGLRYHEDEEDRFQWSDGYRMESGGDMILTSHGDPGAAGGGDNRVNLARAIALYAKDDITLGKWIFSPGVRYENIYMRRDQYDAGDPGRDLAPTQTKTRTQVVVPGIGAHWQMTRALGVFGGAHKGFAPPGPGAAEETVPEESVNYEAGMRFAQPRMQFQVVGFANQYENLLGKDTFASGGTGSGDLFNGGAVDVYGVEAGLNLNLINPLSHSFSLPIDVAYTYTYGEFKTSFDSDYAAWGSVSAGDQLPYLPEHQLTVSAGYNARRFSLRAGGNYMSEMRTVAGQGPTPDNEKTDARLIFDATTEVTLAKSLRVFASIQNITDQVYIAARRPAGLRPGLPRRVSAGIKVDL